MEKLQFRVFEPREFIAQGDKVVVLVHSEITVTPTGRDFANSDAHVWTLRAGKVARQQSYEDTAAVADAYRGR
jgi:ketosteroid isomerase-like protein